MQMLIAILMRMTKTLVAIFYVNFVPQLLRREIDAALLDRDRTIKEAHELREKLGIIMIITMRTYLKKNFNIDNYRDQTID